MTTVFWLILADAAQTTKPVSNRTQAQELERANPNIAKPDRIPMVLQHQRPLGNHSGELGGRGGLALHRSMILNQNAVVEHRERAGLDLPIGGRSWCVKDDIIDLP